jgi:hypothetical protein
MEAILVKVEDDYRLLNQNNSIIGTTDYEYQKAFSDVCKKLSLKNCQAIENGYDLDELIKEELISVNTKVHRDLERDGWIQIGLVRGFQKALEIIGDKKFSEDDIYRAFEEGERQDRTGLYDIIRPTEQTEWDVEIVMIHGFDDINDPKPFSSPKLDADGCLILRRK